MIDFKTIAYFGGTLGETEFATMLDDYIRKLKRDGWSVLLEHERYNEEQSELLKKPTFENRMLFMKII
jgi:hypothetical protein